MLMDFPIAHNTLGAVESESVRSVLASGELTMGKRVDLFEDRFAQYVGAKHAVMVNSGSSADFVMMLAAVELGILKRNQEITMSAVTWPSQAWAALLAGLRICFVDPDIGTLQAPADFQVHLLGNPKLEHAPLFEDCCEALGARWDGKHVGTFGKAGAFSFFFSHHITTIEGGAIVTDDDEFADMCRIIRAHGWARDIRDESSKQALTRIFPGDQRFLFVGPGLNFRPTEISAALGLLQLQRLDGMIEARNEHYRALAFSRLNFNETSTVYANHRAAPAWFVFPVILKDGLDRQECCSYLSRIGIETRPIMGGNLLRQPAFSAAHWSTRVRSAGPLATADRIHRQGFYVGLPPFKTDIRPLIMAISQMATSQLVPQDSLLTMKS